MNPDSICFILLYLGCRHAAVELAVFVPAVSETVPLGACLCVEAQCVVLCLLDCQHKQG
jgi:hypothetical protein